MSGLERKVEIIDTEALNECEMVIVFASSYNREIILKLKEMKYNGDIIVFEQSRVKLLCNGSY